MPTRTPTSASVVAVSATNGTETSLSRDRQRIAALNRAYLQTALAMHRAGHDAWLLSRFDLSSELLSDLAALSPIALDSLLAEMGTTLFSVEVDATALTCADGADPVAGLAMADGETLTAPGTWLVATVLQELAACNVYSESASYRFNCEQAVANTLSGIHPLLLASLAAHPGTVLRARFSRNHVMAADMAGAFPVGLLMCLH